MQFAFLLLALVWTAVSSKGSKPVFTQVTYLYDIHRGQLAAYKRPFQYYLDNFNKLLKTDTNLIIFGGKDIKNFVWERRKEENTIFIEREIEEYQKNWYADPVQKLRQKFLAKPDFQWKAFPSYALKNYDVIMMAKLYLCEEALKLDKWNTDFMIWTDAGYAHIYRANVYSPENIVMNYYKYIQPQWSAFTYQLQDEVFHGYEKGQLRYVDRKVLNQEKILAGNMGGYATIVKDIKNAFENLLRITLEYGDFYSDEPIITLIPIRFPFIFPTTLVLNLERSSDTFYIYQQINRITEHQRYFKITIDKAINHSLDDNKKQLTSQNPGKKIQNSNDPHVQQNNNKVGKRQAQIEKTSENDLKNQFFIRKEFTHKVTNKKIIYFAIFAVFYAFFLSQNTKYKKKLSLKFNQLPEGQQQLRYDS